MDNTHARFKRYIDRHAKYCEYADNYIHKQGL